MLLIDTPGFDDTDRSDVDILANIAEWVQRASYLRKHLSGIIYLHRISDMRMEGSSVKNLRMFRELCGEKNFSNVILCTTMWDQVGEEDGRGREEELKSTRTFWGSLISRGAQVVRHQGDLTASARKIAESLIQKDTIALKLQEELDRNGSLSNTSAGRVLTGEIEVMKKKHQEEMEALRAEIRASSDKKEIELLKEYYEKEIEGLRKATGDLEKVSAENEYYKETEGFRKSTDDLGRLRAENEYYKKETEGFKKATDDLEKLRAENEYYRKEIEGLRKATDDLERLRVENEYYKEEIKGLRKATDDLEKLRAEDARRLREGKEDILHLLDKIKEVILR